MSNYSIFCFPFSVQCVASFLIYCALLSLAVKTELLTSLWPFCRALNYSSSQMETRLLTQHLKARFYYYFNFTAGYKQSDGGPKHSLTLGVQDMTVILHSTPCAASTTPPTCCGSKRLKRRASHQAQRIKAAHHDRLSVTSRANLVVAKNTEAPG